MEIALGLLPVVAPPVLGAIAGYLFPAASIRALIIAATVVAAAPWVVSGWLGLGVHADLDPAGRVALFAVLLAFLVGLFAAGLHAGRRLRENTGV